MADLQRKTANLFDKDNTTIYNAYLAVYSESSIWITSEDSRSVKMPCKPNTQYTLSISSAIPIFRICSSSNANIEPSGEGVRVRTIIRSENIQQYTFTTSANDVCIIFQGSASLVNEWFNSLMLNTGSIPLPYEPYGWLHSLRKLDTATDTITTLPADVYADGNNATVGLKGNMQQTGTPTPQNPIQPQECGVRTENLFDINGETDVKATSITIINNAIKFENVPSGNTARIIYSAQYTAGTYYISCVASGSNYSGVRLFSNSSFTGATYNSFYGGYYRDFATSGFSASLTFDNDFKIGYIANAAGGSTFTISDIMLSTAEADYQPYGYKLAISSASTTTPVYLGEVESTRQIKKLVLTGQETFTLVNSIYYGLSISPYLVDRNDLLSSHFFVGQYSGALVEGQLRGIGTPSNTIIFNYDNGAGGVEDFKSWLAAQYATGTPVTVWYVLAEPETAVVNEPLRKIGDYADTVSGITIPTITGKDTFDVETTLKPSEVELTYTGWHDASVKEWDGSQWG